MKSTSFFALRCLLYSYYFSIKTRNQTYNESTLKTAIVFLNEMDAHMGDTEILEPLQAIYDGRIKRRYSRQVSMLC